MIEYILQTTLIALCGLAFKIQLWKRSISTCIFLITTTLYIFTKDYINDFSYIFILFGLVFAFIRAIFKPNKERLFYDIEKNIY